MIRSLGLMEIMRAAAQGPPDLAALPTRAAAGGQPPLRGYALALERIRYKRSSVGLASIEKGKLLGIVSARQGKGPTAWTVDHLAVLEEDNGALGELLGAASASAAKRGAERLLLRLPDEWTLQKAVAQAGFAATTQVLLLTLPGRSPLSKEEPLLNTRLRRVGDDHALFRLYNACTPAEVRFKIGLTMQQWRDAEEPETRRTRQLVVERGGEIAAWLRFDDHYGWKRVRTMLRPAEILDPSSLVTYVVRSGGRRGVLWEVPEYQTELHLLLERMGFEVSTCYRLMVKTLAPMIKERAWAPAPTTV